MAGFPHETDRCFRNTFNFLNKISPSRMHIFPYSPRKGTAAFSLSKVDDEIVKDRLKKLSNLARKKSFAYRKRFLNNELVVLVEETKDRKTGLLKGYSDNYIKVLIKNKKPLKKRHLVRVKVVEVTPESTFAIPL